MAKCQPRVGLVVMIGLPGSGKSTLAKSLCQLATMRSGDSERKHVHLFTYDELIPVRVQSGKDAVSWKQARDNVKERVEHMVCQLNEVTLKENSCLDNKQNTLLIIDDNMYYRSMRYEYFQLARKYKLSFCQLNLSVTADKALQRNRSRLSDSVPEEVINRMSDRLQPPDMEHNIWERHSLTIAAHQDINTEAVYDFVTSSLEHPVQPVAQSMPSVQPSFVHSVDLQLRKLVGEMMRVTSGEKQTLRAKAAALNLQRHGILARLRAGDVSIPTENVAHFLTQQLRCDDNDSR